MIEALSVGETVKLRRNNEIRTITGVGAIPPGGDESTRMYTLDNERCCRRSELVE